MSNRLDGKVAIVTGGTMGIGYAIAEKFVEEGAKVVITGRKTEVGEKAASEIGSPDQIAFIQQDVADEDRWTEVFDETEKKFGPVTTLVNNAGIGLGGDIEHTSTEDWHKTIAINLDSVFFGTRLGVQRMKNSEKGASIINMSSIEGFVGDPRLAAYNATKGAVRLLSKSAALYTAKQDYNVRVNTVHPGYIATPMVKGTPMETAMSDRNKTPMGHLGDPDDIAYMAVFLASDESKFATGSEFVVDGGYTAQ
ncbi:NAD(P)-dependent dehydrogenase (short-subunit alcohol dehydrogenase family) [Weissella uvarum]|uniref:SDR family oxidoreductase n=1 Tax=Weissella uvarum TaxID=1479233 RepID=UPI001960C464|nr:SDR family oxidoreductase [Weissella uvarum]MBM7617229.1 NAD(P)-dependent dehydrogenase (short-subunit alcohol dehydrogenase family) [Weissella uvarum]MCM0595522.1 glucose 1-dehydrogenase [Weissella uvarum]